jgi:hypothetical protein
VKQSAKEGLALGAGMVVGGIIGSLLLGFAMSKLGK